MNKPIISMIACIGKNRELGIKNGLLWNLPNDLKRFKEITSGHPVIMGKRTYDSIGKALPNRTNIVLNLERIKLPDAVCATSIDEAVKLAKEKDQEEIFVIGGGQIYKQMIGLADKLYLTIVDDEKEADTFFPEYDDFTKAKKVGEDETDGLHYEYWEFTR